MLRKITFLIGTLLACNAYAQSGDMLIGVSAGPTWSSGNKTQTLFLEPDVQKTYTGGSSNTVFPTAEIFIGLQKPVCIPQTGLPLMSQFGIDLVGAGNAKLRGDIWEDADPTFDNFNYSYKVTHAHVAAKGRLIACSCNTFQPYVSGSIGVGVNRAYDFSIQPKIPQEVPAPAFTSNTTTSFVYTLGFGVQTSLSSQLQVAIGYEFADWGKTQLSAAPGQTVNQAPSLNHLYAQQLQLSVFYII